MYVLAFCLDKINPLLNASLATSYGTRPMHTQCTNNKMEFKPLTAHNP